MRRYNIFHPLLLSFYSKSLYQDVGRNWPGTGFLYLLLLVALVWIPATLSLQDSFARWVEQEAPEVTSQIPAITISNGEVSTDVETPYFIRDPEKETLFAIIDLTGEYASLDDSEARLLLTKDKLFLRQNDRETRMYDLSDVKEFTLDQAMVEGWLDVLAAWLPAVVYPFAVLFSFLYRIVQALIYAAIGLLFAKRLRAPLDYQALLRLAVVAVTPVILLDTVRDLASVAIPFRWPLAFVVAMAYLFYAVKVNSETETVP